MTAQEKIDSIMTLLSKKLENYIPENSMPDGEYFNPYDWYGGNADDIYEGGRKTGAYELAQTLKELLEK